VAHGSTVAGGGSNPHPAPKPFKMVSNEHRVGAPKSKNKINKNRFFNFSTHQKLEKSTE
jgi:hypothetical protein